MSHKFSLLLALSALILSAGCRKAITSSVDLSTGAKAGYQPNPSWQLTTPTDRLIAFDIDDGTGSSCLLSYDIGTNQVELSQVKGDSSVNLFTTSGIWLDNHEIINVNTYAPTDNYNEVGGYHIIAYDATGSGHQDHLLLYVPGQGIAIELSYDGGGFFHQVWPASPSTSGIGGYNLASVYDKIISYDYGSGAKTDLICYRPGNGICWVLENSGTPTSPTWTALIKGTGGIGGFDLKGTSDQLVAVDYNPGYMNLVAYRPGFGYLWYLTHNANSTLFTAAYTTRSGFFNFSFTDQQDRMIAANTSGSTASTADNSMICYRPGGGMGITANDAVSGNTVSGGMPPYGLSPYPMSTNPYGSPPNIGDKMLAFSGNGYGNSSLVCYTNGGTSYSTYIFEYQPNTSEYTLALH
jgi:hypothetical protein